MARTINSEIIAFRKNLKKHIDMHGITYVFLMGSRNPIVDPLIPFPELLNPYITSIGGFPQSLEQFAYGIDYYKSIYNSGEHFGYKVLFVYEDSIDDFGTNFTKTNGNEVAVFFLCTGDSKCISHIENAMRQIQRDYYAFVCLPQIAFLNGCNNVFHSQEEIYNFLYKVTSNYLNITTDNFGVPCAAKSVDLGLSFAPTIPNTYTLESILGNWEFHFKTHTIEEHKELFNKVRQESNTFNRQQLILGQIQQFAAVEKCERDEDNIHSFGDQLNAPLVISLPFTNTDTRKHYEGQIKLVSPGNKSLCNLIMTVLSQGTTHNYTFQFAPDSAEGVSSSEFQLMLDLFFLPRCKFHDFLGTLHCSYRFSPYLRLPFLGKDIDRQLSFVNPQIVDRLMHGTKRNSIENVMKNVGDEISKRTLSNELKKHLKEYPRQIVAITDLPIEWLDLDGVPLGFSHDVCRMPETPIVGNMMHYVINEIQNYQVPRDIIKHTLVVFGTQDASFKFFQDEATELSKILGFTTRVCLNINELDIAIKEIKPQFLIMDCHGGADMKLKQTFLYIGNEKLYPDEIAKRNITAPLVFLSACNTAPTYHTFNTVANAMVECGALTVTSSYMPLWVREASELYVRILNQLSICAKMPYHKNWLAFISHMLRTSYIHGAFRGYYTQSKKSVIDTAREPQETLTESMYFQLRRELYFKLKSGKELEGIKVNTKSVVPHYLMYTTIGRADLINFQCYMEEKFS